MRGGGTRAGHFDGRGARRMLATTLVIGAATLGGCASAHDLALTPGTVAEPSSPATDDAPARADSAAQRALLDAIAQRLLAGEEVAAYKTANGLPISDPAREAEVIAAAAASAAEQGIDEQLVRSVVTDQITASKIVQEGFQQRWAAGSGTPPADPSLDRARGVISSATAAIVTGLGAGVACPLPSADLSGLSAELQQLGLERESSDRAAHTATGSLCG